LTCQKTLSGRANNTSTKPMDNDITRGKFFNKLQDTPSCLA
jgi:hypothetical protein